MGCNCVEKLRCSGSKKGLTRRPFLSTNKRCWNIIAEKKFSLIHALALPKFSLSLCQLQVLQEQQLMLTQCQNMLFRQLMLSRHLHNMLFRQLMLSRHLRSMLFRRLMPSRHPCKLLFRQQKLLTCRSTLCHR
jgi:hypothetical protein